MDAKVTGQMGTENYTMSNCPFHLPKQNLDFFNYMQGQAKTPYNNFQQYGNAYHDGWLEKKTK